MRHTEHPGDAEILAENATLVLARLLLRLAIYTRRQSRRAHFYTFTSPSCCRLHRLFGLWPAWEPCLPSLIA